MARALLVAALLLPVVARAQATLALRAAYATSVGSAAQGLPLSDAIGAQVPLRADALWRFGAGSAGVYASWGPGRPPEDGCADGADCSASAVRLGLQGQWAFAPVGAWRLVPWGGVGAGWERTTSRRARLGSETVWTYSGPEASLHGGLDWPLGGGVALGPFAEVAFGRHGSYALDTSADSASGAIPDKGFHAHLHLGVRCSLEL